MALSNGRIPVYILDLNGEQPQLRLLYEFTSFPTSVLVLSLATQPGSTSTLGTLATGEVSVLRIENEQFTQAETWKAHDLEAWCSAWKSSETILTGGDDCLLKLWDLRDEPRAGQLVNKRFTS